MVVQRHRDDEKLITDMIEHWVASIRAGDLPGVLAGHADDIVMFDVPPPQNGVRGIDAYRDTWPPFFRWLADGAVFELVSTDVTAGAETAFAHLLVRWHTRRSCPPSGSPATHHNGAPQGSRAVAHRS